MAAEETILGTRILRSRFVISGALAMLLIARLMALPVGTMPRAPSAPLIPGLFAAVGTDQSLVAAQPETDAAYTGAIEAMRLRARIARANQPTVADLDGAGDTAPAVTRSVTTVVSSGVPPIDSPIGDLVAPRHSEPALRRHAHRSQARPGLAREPNLAFESAFGAAGTTDDNTFGPAAGSGEVLAPIHEAARNAAFVPSETTTGRIDGVRGTSDAGHLGDVTVKTEALVQHLEPVAQSETHSKYDALDLETSVTVPAFRHPVHISIGGGYERLTQANDGHAVTALDADSAAGFAGSNTVTGTTNSAVLTDSNRLNVSRAGYTAAASVPLSHHLNVGVGYSQRDVRGDAGFVQSAPVDERQQSYTGSVTYAPRGGRSSISLVGESARAVDATTSTIDSSVKRGDLLFSVKF